MTSIAFSVAITLLNQNQGSGEAVYVLEVSEMIRLKTSMCPVNSGNSDLSATANGPFFSLCSYMLFLNIQR